MRKDGRRSTNIEDRRGMGMPGGPAGIGGLGLIAIVVIAALLGVDPREILGQLPQQPASEQGPAAPPSPEEEALADFVSLVLADTEDTWTAIFSARNATYEEPKLVLFTGAVQSACGFANAAVGPFYCPGDRKVYLDLAFFQELGERFKAPGDFAMAYVIAHEVGHHVQTIMGISDQVRAAQARASKEEANAFQVRMELQADCFAGLWAHNAERTRQILEQGDIEEALGAAAAVGDDRLQKQSQGYVVPESFTHGTSEQRMAWFKKGLQTGALESCDTFAAGAL